MEFEGRITFERLMEDLRQMVEAHGAIMDDVGAKLSDGRIQYFTIRGERVDWDFSVDLDMFIVGGVEQISGLEWAGEERDGIDQSE